MFSDQRDGRYWNRRALATARWHDVRGGLFDLLAIVAVLILIALGGLNLYAVSGRSVALHQLELAAAGLVVFAVLRTTRSSGLPILGWFCYGVSVLLLLAVQFVGISANGAKRWLAAGSLTFQPSELAKLGLLLILAHVLGSGRVTLRRLLLAMTLAAVPIALTVLEPDLSTATLLIALAVAMLVLGRVPTRFLLPLLGAAALIAPLAVELLRPYQLARLHVFLSGSQSAAGPGWAVLQSHIALASGGLLGQSRAPLHRLLAEYLPGQHADLALASLVEQWGMVAAGVALLAAVVLVWRVALASRLARTRQASLVGAGLAALLGAETVVALGGNLGVLPVAGVPFPLLSLGGTAAAVHLAALALVLGARREGVRRRLWSPPRWLNPRPRWVRLTAITASGLLVALAAYGWQLQEAQGVSLRAARDAQMIRCVTLPAARGVITDRHGIPVAMDVAEDQIEVVPSIVLRQPRDLDRLAALIGEPPSTVRAAVYDGRNQLSVNVARVPANVAFAVAAAGIPEVLLVPVPQRVYPYGSLLGPLLGFVGVATPPDNRRWANLPPGEIVGRAGIEEEYDPILRGLDGQQCMYVDPASRPVALAAHRAAVPGAALQLSIDLGLQQELTADLATALKGGGFRPVGDLGGVVAMDPRNGQVLAMASLPSYDNNLYGPPLNPVALREASIAPGSPMLDHVTQSVAPPGSTFKLVVAATDTVYPVLPPDKVVPTGASFTLGNHSYANWAPLGPMNLVQSIAWSNDVYFYKLAWALGADRIYQIGSDLGVGQPTGIDLPGESRGYFGNPLSVSRIGAVWYSGTTVILGIGQGYLDVTPLQDARWTAAVVTGSVATPRLGLAMAAGGGPSIPIPAPPPVPLSFAANLAPIRDGMRQAATTGTAALLSDLPVPVGAKTGSAQDPASPNGVVDSWLTAAAPFPAPAVVMTSLVRGGGEGAVTSGPLIDQALRYFLAHEGQVLAEAG